MWSTSLSQLYRKPACAFKAGFPPQEALVRLASAHQATPALSPPICCCSQRQILTECIADGIWHAAYPTWTIFRPSFTSCGKSLTSLRFCAGRTTVLTPARSAPISFSLMPPTAVTRPRSEISPCDLCKVLCQHTVDRTGVRCTTYGHGDGRIHRPAGEKRD
jgi:hypothetical protein